MKTTNTPQAHTREILEKFLQKKLSREEALALLKSRPSTPENPTPVPTETSGNLALAPGELPAPRGISLEEAATNYLTRHMAALGKGTRPERNFMELGLGSADLMALNTQLEQDLGIDLVPTVFFNHSSIGRLANHLATTFPEQLTQALLKGRQEAPPSAPTPEPIAPPPPSFSPEEKTQSTLGVREDDIAIIGMAGMFAQSPDLESFWSNLTSEKALIEEVPLSRWDPAPWYDPSQSRPDTIACKWGSFVPDVDKFDPLFFHISPREAEVMDPQLRLLLQTLYNTAEDAGCLRTLRGSRTGMFVGACFRDYNEEMLRLGLSVGPHDGTGNAATMLANRPSFFFDLKGPSLTVDTACSSSLVALHLACQALRRGECEMAFAGGVNLILSPRHYLHFSAMKALSPTGRCHTFDSSADGYVPGEGVAAVLLKPLAQALQDGDPIHAVIKGSAVNHGGYTNSITAPSPAMQAELLLEAWKDAGIEPETLSYIEAHGTGTRLGDPIEVDGLKLAFSRHTTKQRFCALGSAKAHLGHTEAAAGIAGIIKVVLSMQHGLIPTMPGFRELNPYIKLDGSPLYINEKPKAWLTAVGLPRRSGVSSFGFGGANAHVVLEEYVRPRESEVPAIPQPFPFSAQDHKRLRELAEKFHSRLSSQTSLSLLETAHTLQTGRDELPARLVIIARSQTDLLDGLTAFLEARETTSPLLVRLQEGSPVLLRPEEASAQGAVEKLAGRWLLGEQVIWPLLSNDSTPQRVSLPTSTFARERYWLEGQSAAAAETVPVSPPPLQPPAAPELAWFKTEWSPASLTGLADTQEPLGTVLLFIPSGFDSAPLEGNLREAKSSTGLVRVRPGAQFRCIGPHDYEIAPGKAEDYERLLTALADEGIRFGHILFNWAESPRFETPSALLASLDEALQQSVYPLVHLTQALLSRRKGERVKLLCVHPTGEGTVSAHHEALAGFARAVTASAPWLTFRILGIEESGTAHESLAKHALPELQAEGPSLPVEVRYQGGQRQARQVIHVPPAEALAITEPAFRENGIYLVTGGAGVLGYEVAKHLAKRYRARLILTGRSPLDDETRRKLSQLEEMGADAVYLRADVASRKDMDHCLAYAKARFSGLHGIIHCAGLLKEGTLASKSLSDFEATLSAKIQGTLTLDHVTRAEPLDVFVVFSSVSTLIGTALASDYATANRFLDSFASQRASLQQRGLRHGQTLSIGYPYWREGGMRMSTEKEAMVTQATGMEPLSISHGLQALETAVGLGRRQGLSHVVTGFGKLEKMQRAFQSAPPQAASGSSHVPTAVPPKPQSSPIHREKLEGRLTADLANIVVKILRLKSSVDARADLSGYGFESITIVEFIQELNTRYGTKLSPALFYEHRTLESYARLLLEEHASNVLRAYPDAAPPAESILSPPSVSPSETLPRAPLPAVPVKSAALPLAEDIAVIGMAGVFPGSPDLETFWRNIVSGKDLVGEIPRERFNWESFHGEAVPEDRRITSSQGGFIADVDRFDPLFFGLSPLEAEVMDPQQRLFLETVWRTLEDAGYKPEALSQQKTGVFVGVSNVDYRDVLAAAGRLSEVYITTGLSTSLVANRISYLFDWRGPSEPVDTGCSSSLVALHRAVAALHSRDCTAAIVGGVNLLLSPTPFIACSRAGMLSPDGRCMTFDKRANGYVRGEGAGAVLLKPLSQAIADGDRIHALIRGTGVNHGGHAQGLTVPNPRAQSEVLISVYEKAGVDPATLGYIETHGTGTSLGDPVEISGLRKLFSHFHGNPPPTRARCGLGTVKTNIGHLESAAGIAGIIKVILSLKHRTLPASLHCQELNPFMSLADSPLYVVKETQPWEPLLDQQSQVLPRRAGVSSFGFGGVNAHVLLEEYAGPPVAQSFPPASKDGRELIVLSAKALDRLTESAKRLASFLQRDEARALALPDIAHTLQVGRREMEHRLAIATGSVEELSQRLEDFVAGRKHADIVTGRASTEGHTLRMLGESDEGKAFLNSLVRKGALMDLGRLWTQGTSLPWSILGDSQSRRRISLPGYPFARLRCWASPDGSSFPVPTAPAISTTNIASAPAPVPLPSPVPPPPLVSRPNARPEDLHEAVCEYLQSVIAQVLKLTPGNIDVEAPFPDYGIDSLVAVNIVKFMEPAFGTLQRALLFEHVSISSLAAFLVAEHQDRCAALLAPNATAEPMAQPPASPPESVPAPQVSAPSTRPHGKTPLHPTVPASTDIAIIGMAGIFPGSRDLKTFWRNLEECRDLISEVPPDRFDWRKHFGDSKREAHKSITRWGGFIDEVDRFDPLFFNISPREAELMDPKQRIFLEVVWKTIEDAGYRPSRLRKTNTGVFVGTTSMDYYQVLHDAQVHDDAYAPTGLAPAVLANRVSFLLGLHGPSEPVDTACSSSLVALHNAVRAIQTGDCDMALAGGVNVLLTPDLFVAFSQGGFMSPDGRCKSFSRRANGFVRGEGAGAVLLKPLHRAIADGDHIHGIIKGSGVNHGGEVQSLTVPNPWAQAELISKVLDRAGIDPETVGYIEAHGTGTALGDPIEVNGLERAFSHVLKKEGRAPSRTGYCGIGALKSNIGHLEAAAGIAGVIKVLLAMKHRQLPGIVHLEAVNPDIQLQGSPFYLLEQTRPWEPLKDAQGQPLPRRAGVTSLGFGGSNAHMVLEEFLPPSEDAHPPSAPHEPHLFVLSAKTGSSLREQAANLLAHLMEGRISDENLADIAWTLQDGRDAMPARLAVVARSTEELRARYQEWLEGKASGQNVLMGTVPSKRGSKKPASNGHTSDPRLEAALANRELLTLAALWTSGTDIPWESLHPTGGRRRVQLPTYPFARDRYWPQPVLQSAPPVPASPVGARPETPQSGAKEDLRELLLQLKRRERSVDDVARLLKS
ncbi:SDR family NAD(P)-dependent oxidoreductase [Stigmatella sp. ncwal1]|uniref:SDR family NAD(P)-dependent oxidoreductase n=1 Tax=Stigmatella ashevillensis TaxID=2995309 RepID=A0ABT5D4G1_9BACT|nr:SDR family NAD(P)-dependent oxidoreductase [Stigmatella ashevillena]MDC0708551.1 SDR family NAD(P)-dependent oxidoreductase [Stigmatella ashevillena]